MISRLTETVIVLVILALALFGTAAGSTLLYWLRRGIETF